MPLKEELARRKQRLSTQQQDLLARRVRSAATRETVTQIIPKRPEAAVPLASFAQQRIWFLQQLEVESSLYNEHMGIRIHGPLETAALVRALRTMMSRHEALRTHFEATDGQVRQIIWADEEAALPITLHDMRSFENGVIHSIVQEEMQKAFDLSGKTLWWATLIQVAEDEHILLIVLHHIICDAWSLSIFRQDLFRLYEAFQNEKPSPLQPLVIQYSDFAHWQQRWLEESNALSEQLAYWKHQLRGSLPVLEFPARRARGVMQTYAGNRIPLVVPEVLYQQMGAYGRQHGITPFMLLLSAYTLTLHRYTRQEDIVVGTLIAGRTHPELESIIGYFANTLALRMDLSANPTCEELIQRAKSTALEAYAHQDLPFEKLVEHLQPERSMSHTPIFQTMLILQNVPPSSYELRNITLSPYEGNANVTAKFDLAINVQEQSDGLRGYLEYNTDLFDDKLIERFAGHIIQVLANMISCPRQRIAHLPVLSPQEHRRMFNDWNASAHDYLDDVCLAALFEKQVERTPHAHAVVCEEETLSYAELNARANKVAAHLREVGVRQETLVAILLERDWRLPTAILGIYKANAAYVPLDPHHPPSRMQKLLEDSDCFYILGTEKFLATLPEDIVGERIAIDTILMYPYSIQNVVEPGAVEQLAYIIYTSGSTGKPKGAMVEQRGMVNHLYSKIVDLHITDEDRVAQTASQCFDISVWQLFAPLIVGGAVHILSDGVTHDPNLLFKEVDNQQITILELVPSLLQVALEQQQRSGVTLPSFVSLRWMVMTGEALPPALCHFWFRLYPNIPMFNAYGPTECSDDVATAYIISPPSIELIHMPIGKPVINTRLYVLDARMEPVPVGVSGELYVGGAGVGRGYCGDVTRTIEAFVPDPFSSIAGLRLYRTGDTVRWLEDGSLEYLERVDSQVKVRGYRIELGEIEHVLSEHPAIQQCVVTVREDRPGEKYLAAYLVALPGHRLDLFEIRGFARTLLPEYMVPTAYGILAALPLNANGKIDRRALPEPEHQRLIVQEPRPPALEVFLSSLWADALAIERVGRQQNFFELGGHSVLGAQLMVQMQEIFGVEFPVVWLFEYPTPEKLAARILQMDQPEKQTIETIADLLLNVAQFSDAEAVALLGEQNNMDEQKIIR